MLVLTLGLRAVGQTTAPAEATVAIRAYLDAATTLFEAAADDPVIGDDAAGNAQYIKRRLAGIEALRLVLDRKTKATIEKLEQMEDRHERQMQTQDAVRLALILHDGALASEVLLKVSEDDRTSAAVQGQPKPEWPKLEVLAANVPSSPPAPPARRQTDPSVEAIKRLREPVKSQVAQAIGVKSWQSMENMAQTADVQTRIELRVIEACARLKAGDAAGAEHAARLAVEAATNRADPSAVAAVAGEMAGVFWDAGDHAAARKACARGARLTQFIGDNPHMAPDALRNLAFAQREHGDLAAALAWINRIARPNLSQRVRVAVADRLIQDVMECRATAPPGTSPESADVPPDGDGLFENEPIAFWLDLQVKRQKDPRLLIERFDEDAVEIALSSIGKPAVPAIIDQMKRSAGEAGGPFARGYSPALVNIGADAAPALIDLLRTTPGAEAQAGETLRLIGDPAIGPLLAAAKDSDPRVRHAVAMTLFNAAYASSASSAKAMAATLDTLEKDPDEKVRAAAMNAMNELLRVRKDALASSVPSSSAPAAGEAAPTNPLAVFVRALGDPQPNLRLQAALNLHQQGTPEQLKSLLPQLTAALRDPDAKVRREVVLAIAKIGPPAEPVMSQLLDWRTLCGDTTDGSPGQIAAASAQALAAIGTPAVAPLIEQLKSSDEYVRQFAREALRATQPATVAANLKPFADLLADPEHGWWVRNVIGPAGSAGTPLVLRLLTSDDPLMRDHAMQIAYQIFQKEPDPQLLSAVIDKLIAHPEDDIGQTSGVIQAMGGRAKLIERVSARSDPPEVRAVLMDALARIQDFDQPAEQNAALWRGLYHGEPSATVRAAAVRAYIYKVLPPKPLGPNLEPLTDRDPAVRLAVLKTLLEGKGSYEFDPTSAALLTNLLHDPSDEVQLATARVLKRNQKTSGPAVLTLVDLLEGSKDQAFKLRVIEAASEDHRFDELLMKALGHCTNDPSPAVKVAAIRALRDMIVPADKLNTLHAGLLVTMRDDKDPQVRNEAALTLLLRGPNDEPARAAGYVHPPPGSPEIAALLKVAAAPRTEVDQTIEQALAAMKVAVVRARLYELLVRFRGGEMAGQRLILAALAEPTAEVRRIALKLAIEFPSRDGRDGEQIFKLVSPLLSDKDPAVRMAALEVLKRGWGGLVVRPLKEAMAKYPDDAAFHEAASLLIHRTMIQSRI